MPTFPPHNEMAREERKKIKIWIFYKNNFNKF